MVGEEAKGEDMELGEWFKVAVVFDICPTECPPSYMYTRAPPRSGQRSMHQRNPGTDGDYISNTAFLIQM